MTEIRCTSCNKLLYKINNPLKGHGESVKIAIPEGYKHNESSKIEIQCPRCKEMNTNQL